MNQRATTYRRIFPHLFFVLELILQSIVFYFVWITYYNPTIRHMLFRGNYLLTFMYFMVLLVCVLVTKGNRIGENRIQEMIAAQGIALLMTAVIIYFPASLLEYALLNPVPLLVMLVVQGLLIILWNWIAKRIYIYAIPPMNVLLVTDHNKEKKIAKKIVSQTHLYHLATCIKADAEETEDFFEMVKNYDAVMLGIEDQGLKSTYAELAFRQNVRVLTIPSLPDIIVNSSLDTYVSDTPLLRSSAHSLNPIEAVVKRTADILFSLLAILLTSPIWLVVSVAIKLCDGGPVFFRQERLTLNGKVFRIYKFRSMRENAEENGPQLATEQDDRITPVGKVIRKLRIDELPQFLNVLLGDMSVVGPRPELPVLTEEYAKDYPLFPARLKVKAGITGLAQVYGNYATHPEDKLLMDLIYIEQFGFVLDMSIVLMTVKALFLTDKTKGVKEED